MIAPGSGVAPTGNPSALAAAYQAMALPFQGMLRRVDTYHVQYPLGKFPCAPPGAAAAARVATTIGGAGGSGAVAASWAVSRATSSNRVVGVAASEASADCGACISRRCR